MISRVSAARFYLCTGGRGNIGLSTTETGPVRLADRRLSQGEATVADIESRRVARWLYDGRPPHLWRHFDLQGGAVLLARSPAQRRFAAAARRAFVDLWRVPFARELIASVNGTDAYAMVEKAVGLRRKRNTDQPALDLGAARLLVEGGAEVNARDANGVTCLHLACMGLNKPLTQLFISHGADLHARAARMPTVQVRICTPLAQIVSRQVNEGRIAVFIESNRKYLTGILTSNFDVRSAAVFGIRCYKPAPSQTTPPGST